MNSSHGVRPPLRIDTLRGTPPARLDCGQPPRRKLIVRKKGASPLFRATNSQNTREVLTDATEQSDVVASVTMCPVYCGRMCKLCDRLYNSA